MTQMIGRALRGEAAQGTKEAYIVTFIDQWREHIAWVNPQALYESQAEFSEKSPDAHKRNLHLISISLLEQFARIMDDTVDTAALESVSFEKRIPLGMYVMTYLDADGLERTDQVLVYNSTAAQYRQMITELPYLFEAFHQTEELIPETALAEMTEKCESAYFDTNMLPAYDERDVCSILKYYAQKGCNPNFIPFDELDRKRVNLADIAKYLKKADLRIYFLFDGDTGLVVVGSLPKHLKIKSYK